MRIILIFLSLILLSCAEKEVRKEYFLNGNIKSEQCFVNGVLDGTSKHYYANSNSIHKILIYKNGVLKKCTYFRKSKELDYEVEMEGQVKHGFGKEYFKNGQLKIDAYYDFGSLKSYIEYDSIGNLTYWYKAIEELDIPIFRNEYINVLENSVDGFVVKVNVPNISPFQLVPRLRSGRGDVIDALNGIWILETRNKNDSIVNIGLEIMLNDSVRKMIGWREFNLKALAK